MNKITLKLTVDENTIDQKKEAILTTETGLEVKRPTRGSRRSIAPPVAESKTSGRAKKSKKAASIKMKRIKLNQERQERRIKLNQQKLKKKKQQKKKKKLNQ